MEDSLDELIPKQVEHIFLYKQFEEVCPYFISIGMTYEQFWYDDISLTKYYQKAFELKEKREAIKDKWARWEQGLYIYEALCDVSPILRAFSKAKKPLQYPSKPYGLEDIQQNKEQNEVQKEKKQEVEKLRAQIFFENWARAAQKRFKEKGEDNG